MKSKLYRRPSRGHEFLDELPGTLGTRGCSQRLGRPWGSGREGSPLCGEPALFSLGDRGCSPGAVCWVWMTREVHTWGEAAETLGWARWVFKAPGVKQGGWSHSLSASLARSVWQVGVEDRTSIATVSTGSPARHRWLPQPSALGGDALPDARFLNGAPRPPPCPTPGITV